MAKLMNEEFMIYDVDYEYRKYLYNYDNRVNLKANRRYTGLIIILDHYKYFVPLTSHPLRNDGKKRNSKTTVEIYDEQNELIAALLINNMIPVPDNCFELVDIPNDKDKDYLNSEYIYIRRSDVKKEIMYKAEKAYRQVKLHQDAFMNRFCCDFNLLERKCDDYIWKKSIIREDIIHYFVTQYI